jgi:hypothetical protein
MSIAVPRLLAGAVWASAAFGIASCAPTAAVKSPSVFEAEQALADAEEELVGTLDVPPAEYAREREARAEAGAKDGAYGRAPQAQPSPPPSQPSPPLAPPGPPQMTDAAPNVTRAIKERVQRCRNACAALAAMARAVERICDLAGDDSESCGAATQRVEFARAFVSSRCGVCN